jgi:hypothetical protein
MKHSSKQINKIIFTSLVIINLFYSVTFAQVQTKFFRPSITTTFIKPASNEIAKVYEGFATLPMEGRFDNRSVNSNMLNITIPPRPEMPKMENPLGAKRAIEDYKRSLKDWDNAVSKSISGSISPIGKEVFGNMFSRTSDGNMSWDKLMEAANYSATDNQALSAKESKNSANEMEAIANELVKRSYYVVYDIKSIKTYEQVYNDIDASLKALSIKTKKPFKPTPRTQEGWQIDFNYFIYKLVWDDATVNDFGDKAWLDASTTDPAERAKKITAFENYEFKFELALSGGSTADASQSNNPEVYKNAKFFKIVRKSMDQLLAELPSSMQDVMVFKGGREIEDFKMRAPIFQEKPITVKLGTKEGLYYDERFFVYEMEQDKEGKTVKKRRGVLRTSNIADNSMIATGTSPASKFRQQGGKKLYQGTLVELYEDYGYGFSIGYGLLDNFIGGATVSAEVRIPRLFKGAGKINKYLRGLYLNVNASYNPLMMDKMIFDDDAYDDAYTKGDVEKEEQDKLNFQCISYGGSLSRETYFTRKGNLYLMPEIGGGLFTASTEDYNDPTDGYDEKEKLTAEGIYVNGSLGLGYHFTPMISFFVKGGFCMKLQPSWDPVIDLNVSKDFKALEGISFPVFAGLRFRF